MMSQFVQNGADGPVDVQEETTPQCRFVREECVASGKWLSLNTIQYTDPAGRYRTWEACERTTRKGPSDGVVIMATLKRMLKYDCVILVKQYRPPMKSYTLEFPAGLADEGETVEQCVHRELKEETGYTCNIKHCSPVTCLDPGTESCTTVIVTAEVDGDLDVNKKPEPEPDEGEFIDVLLIPVNELLERLNEHSQRGVIVDARVYTYAIALAQAHKDKKMEPAQK